MLNYYMPVHVYSSENCVSLHKSELTSLGSRCILVTGKTAAKASGAFDDVVSVLSEAGITWKLFDGITPNPELESCRQAGQLGASFQADFVIGIGGGSPLDAAKAVAVFAANPDLDEAGFYGMEWENAPLPIALIGTTSGTGSEVTNVSVLTDSKKHKHSIHDNRMYAAVSLGDPHYTISLPTPVTLSTGIDVLAHATESYFSRKANEISRAFAIRSISLLLPPLFAASRGDALSLKQREELYEASLLGGLAISVTGTVFPHNMGYYLTENYQVPHGIACAVFLPDLLAHVRINDPSYAEAFYRTLGTTEEDLNKLIHSVTDSLDIHMDAAEIEATLPRWNNNNSVKNTIGMVTLEDIRAILNRHFLH